MGANEIKESKKYELIYKKKPYQIRFKHYRKKVEGDGVTIFDLKGGKTVAFLKINDTVIAEEEALCSDKQIFSKKMGRTIAFGRLKKLLQPKLPQRSH